MLVGILFKRKNFSGLLEVWKREKKNAAFMGLGIYTAYSLVLAAMIFTQNAGYVVAFRQLSIPIGVILSYFFMREPLFNTKIAGTVLVFAGLVMVALG